MYFEEIYQLSFRKHPMLVPMHMQEELMNYSQNEEYYNEDEYKIQKQKGPQNNKTKSSKKASKRKDNFKQFQHKQGDISRQNMNDQSRQDVEILTENRQIINFQSHEDGYEDEINEYQSIQLDQNEFQQQEDNQTSKTATKTKKIRKSRKDKQEHEMQARLEEETSRRQKMFEPVWSSTGIERTQLIEAGQISKYPEPTEHLKISKENKRNKPSKNLEHTLHVSNKNERQNQFGHLSRQQLMKQKNDGPTDKQILAHRVQHLRRENFKHKQFYDFGEQVSPTSSKKAVNLSSIEKNLRKKFESVMDHVETSESRIQQPINDLQSYIVSQINERRLSFTCFCGKQYYDRRRLNQHLLLAHPDDYDSFKVRGKIDKMFYNPSQFDKQGKMINAQWHKNPEYSREVKLNRIQYPKHKFQQRYECVCGKYYEELRCYKIHVGQVHINMHNEKGSFVDFMVYPTQSQSHYPRNQLVGKFVCGCGNSYSCSSALNLHIRNKHAGIRPLKQSNEHNQQGGKHGTHVNTKGIVKKEQDNLASESNILLEKEDYDETQLKINQEDGQRESNAVSDHTRKKRSANYKQRNERHEDKTTSENKQNSRKKKGQKSNLSSLQIQNIILQNERFSRPQSERLNNSTQINQKFSTMKSEFLLNERQMSAYMKTQQLLIASSGSANSQNKKSQKTNLQPSQGLPPFLIQQANEDASTLSIKQGDLDFQNAQQFESICEKMKVKQCAQKMNHILFEKKLGYMKRLEQELLKCKKELRNYVRETVGVGSKRIFSEI